MMANARSATDLQVLLRSDDDDRAPLSSSELQLLRASAGDWWSSCGLYGSTTAATGEGVYASANYNTGSNEPGSQLDSQTKTLCGVGTFCPVGSM